MLSICAIILCQKEIGAIAAHKMLAKLTPSVNLTKILQTAFSFEFFAKLLFAYFLCFEFFGKKKSWGIAACKMLMKLAIGVNFTIIFAQLLCTYGLGLVNFLSKGN